MFGQLRAGRVVVDEAVSGGEHDVFGAVGPRAAGDVDGQADYVSRQLQDRFRVQIVLDHPVDHMSAGQSVAQRAGRAEIDDQRRAHGSQGSGNRNCGLNFAHTGDQDG